MSLPSGTIKTRAPKSDPSAQMLTCELEGCERTFPLGDSHSFTGGLATTGPLHTPPVLCPDEQHFACCLEHAIMLHFLCMRDHVLPAHLKHQEALVKP